MKNIDLSKVIIAKKLSLFEYDRKRHKLSERQLLDYYQENGAEAKRILAADKAQKESFEQVSKYFKNSTVILGRTLKRDFCPPDNLVVVLGGDNYFQYVSHFLDSQLVLGINSDPNRSEGKLTLFRVEDLEQFSGRLKSGQYNVEEWTRIKISLGKKKLKELAVSEVYIGSRERFNISKYEISFKGQKEEQKSSGVLVATGAGSTGWYRSAYGSNSELSDIFPKDSKELHFFVTEIFKGRHTQSNLKKGVISKEDKLEIKNLGKQDSVVSVDSKVNYIFPRGESVVIEIADSPLQVISNY